MRIIVLHNRYVYAGGEDAVVAAESGLLSQRGHEVRLVAADNRTIGGPLDQMRAALHTVYSPAWHHRIADEIHAFRPDIVHVHNFFPLMSPSVYWACGDAGIPVVQTLHNYRLLCPGAMLARESGLCERCLGKPIPWPALPRACYRGNLGATAATVAMLAVHRAAGTWQKRVQAYIALSNFGREKFVSEGFPEDRIHVKPNFTNDCGTGDGAGGYLLFVGRLSVEKGILALLEAYKLGNISSPLKIVGTGPLERAVADACSRVPNVTCLGKLDSSKVRDLMKSATAVVSPSQCYEMLPVVGVEALSVGTPVIAPRLGALAEVVSDGENGLLYDAFDTSRLHDALRYASGHPSQMLAMRSVARAEFERKYTAEVSYTRLIQIYESARRVCENKA